MEYATLNNGIDMPMAGIGTFLLTPMRQKPLCPAHCSAGIALSIRQTLT